MIRIVCERKELCQQGTVVETAMHTFTIEHPKLEAWLRVAGMYSGRSVIGVEICDRLDALAAGAGEEDGDG